MSVYNHREERVYVIRDLIPEESPIIESQYFQDLQAMSESRFVDKLHVSLLTRNEVRAIAEKYPSDHPKDLIMDALGELQLPAIQFAHIQGGKPFGDVDNDQANRFYVGSRLDAEGTRRMNQDVARLLGHFGLTRTRERNNGKFFDFHVSFMKMNDDLSYAEYLAKGVSAAVGDRTPIALSHPIVEHRHLGEDNKDQKAPVHALSLIRRYWPGFAATA